VFEKKLDDGEYYERERERESKNRTNRPAKRGLFHEYSDDISIKRKTL
jgi:hypothetical protein